MRQRLREDLEIPLLTLRRTSRGAAGTQEERAAQATQAAGAVVAVEEAEGRVHELQGQVHQVRTG